MEMLQVLVLLYAISAVLHFIMVGRFGVAENKGTLVFGVIYAALALAVALALPYALWVGLVLTAIGLTGLTLMFNTIARDKSIGVAFWVVDALVIGITLFLLFL
jgi:hypothetical protein